MLAYLMGDQEEMKKKKSCHPTDGKGQKRVVRNIPSLEVEEAGAISVKQGLLKQ